MSACSTPEGVIVWVTRARWRRKPGSRRPLLNARRRHRLGHAAPSPPTSTLAVLLNARRRHRLGHAGDLIGSSGGSWSAQRPKASSSGSPGRARRRRSWPAGCSTPEGVIVWVTAPLRRSPGVRRDCSTPEGVIVWVTRSARHCISLAAMLLNARRRHRLGHGDGPRTIGESMHLLNARRRHRLGHGLTARCSALGGRLLNARRRHRLGHHGPAWRRSSVWPAAQRPKASSSGSHLRRARPRARICLLNARRRHRLGHQADRERELQRDQLLNARRRHRLGHDERQTLIGR